ncbi:MAG: ABC transporter substrate-binding protein [Thermomicrobiales bacterium]
MSDTLLRNHVNHLMHRRQLMRASLLAAGTLALGTKASILAQDATPAATAAVPEGGRLRVAFEGAGSAENLNQMAMTGIDFMRQSHVQEPLARFRGAEQELVLAEAIAPNADGSVWTIALRPNVTWHDGSPFTAADVLSTIAFNQDLANGGLYLPLVANIDTANATIVDDLTLELPLLRPANDLHLLLGAGEILIFQDGFTDTTTMNGTGPFKLASFTPAQSSLLTRNETYWGYPERGPYLDEIELLSLMGATARVNAVEAGQADLAPSIGYADGKRLEASDTVKIVAAEAPDVQSLAFVMRVSEEPFSDIRLRHAVKFGTDRQALIETAFLGFGILGNDLYGIGQAAYNDAIPQRTFDPEAAIALVQEAGAEGLTFEFVVPQGYAGAVEAATVLAEQLKAIGLNPTLTTIPMEEFSISMVQGTLTSPLTFGVGGGFLMSTTWQFNYTPGAGTNLSGWDDPEWLAGFAESQSTPDPARRTELLDALQEQLWDEGGDLVWGYSTALIAKTPRLQGVPATYYPILTRSYFAAE